MDWRKLKVGDTLWYINTSHWDYDSPCGGYQAFYELWKGTVKSINPDDEHPVDCSWDRVGGNANWVKPEWHWGSMWVGTPNIHVEHHYENPYVFNTPEEAIEQYLGKFRETLMAQADKLKGADHGTA